MNPDLSDAGCMRAARLADYIPATFGSPEFLFATALSTHSARTVETLTPLSTQIGVAIDSTFADQDYGVLAQDLLSQPRFTGKLILVCWHHGNIPSLIRALRAKSDEFPDPWDPQAFNLILQLDHAGSSYPKTVSVIEPF